MDVTQKKILIFGASGMLGKAFCEFIAKQQIKAGVSSEECKVICCSFSREVSSGISEDSKVENSSSRLLYEKCDLRDIKSVKNILSKHQPDVIINCAAYTKVDLAETEVEEAFKLNAFFIFELVKLFKELGIAPKFVHFSTDYVFGEDNQDRDSINASLKLSPQKSSPKNYISKDDAFTEQDCVNPINIYGMSKLLGEQFLRQYYGLNHPQQYLILRTSWLHGIHGNNFLHTILKLAKDREVLEVVDDQFGCPTWVDYLVEYTWKLLREDAFGVFHATSGGKTSWYEFAKEIIKIAGLKTLVKPIKTDLSARPARRPLYSVMSVAKLEDKLGEKCLGWKGGVLAHVEEYLKSVEVS